MRRFKERELDILVATTVIEVGIDVPNATVMVIENAERFGLSQLHQLRGRVGRGSEQSYCHPADRALGVPRRRDAAGGAEPSLDQQRAPSGGSPPWSGPPTGSRIAEVDLELRGPGDFFGTRQSGLPEFRVANIVTDGALLAAARDDAFALVANDPQLRREDHRALADHLRSRFAEEMTLLHTG